MTLVLSPPSLPLQTWQPADWQDYVALRDEDAQEQLRLFFDQGWLWIDMGAEEINHASVSDLFTMLFFVWATLHPDQTWTSLGRCLLEQETVKAGAPDLVLYVGESSPRWQAGEPRRINLSQWSPPALVGEISDTTLTTDLDEKKQLYAAMGIAEYWVIDVQGNRVFGFQLQPSNRYINCEVSQVLTGLPFSLLNQALQRLETEANTRVAGWLSEQIQGLKTIPRK